MLTRPAFIAPASQGPKRGNETERAPRMPPGAGGVHSICANREISAPRERAKRCSSERDLFFKCPPTSPSLHLAQLKAGLGGGSLFHS